MNKIDIMILSLGIGLCSCSDWDDHYAASSDGNAGTTAYIWENISNNAELSDFAQLVKKSGYDEVLSADQTYTVWAPVNGSFNYDSLALVNDEGLLNEFVKNHIARNNYQASGSTSVNVKMLNDKYLAFTGNGTYTMNGINISKANIPAINGTVHTINGKMDFHPNIYEYMGQGIYQLDSLHDYYHRYDVRILDEENSVVGPVVNGEVTYLDSVFIETNNLYSTLGAYINREDSSYSMLMPTDEAWNKAKASISSYYNYAPTFQFASFNTSAQVEEVEVAIDSEYLKDSLTHLAMVKYLTFNNNLYANPALKTSATGLDSVVTTTRTVFRSSDADALFEGATRVTMSNGFAFITDSLRMQPWNTWCPPIKIEAERAATQAGFKLTLSNRTISLTNSTINKNVEGSVSGNAYIDIVPSSDYANPEAFFYIPDVLSTTYVVYGVFVPADIQQSNSDAVLPYKMKFEIGYNQADGSLTTMGDNSATFVNDTSRVDTICFGEFTFPMAYEGTGSYSPYIRLRNFTTRSELRRGEYDNEIRLDCIMLIPKELDDYIKEHPDYEWDF